MKKIYFITDHKTGTFWTGKILELFCRNSNYMFIPIPHKGLKGIKYFYVMFKTFTRKDKLRFIYNYFTKNKIYLLNRADIKKEIKKYPSIIMIRDPRDICISAANYDGKDSNDDPKDKDFYNYKKYTENMSFDEIVLFQACGPSLQTIKRLDNFISNNDNSMIIKYEDFFMDIENNYTILEKIFEYLNFDIIERYSFKTFYKITHIKNSGKTSHVKSGKPKQFNDLKEETLVKLNAMLEKYILKLKYPIN